MPLYLTDSDGAFSIAAHAVRHFSAVDELVERTYEIVEDSKAMLGSVRMLSLPPP